MNKTKSEKLAKSTDMEPVTGTVDVDIPIDVLWRKFRDAKGWPKWNKCFFWVHNRDLILGKKLVWVFQPLQWWMLYKMPAMAKIVELEEERKVTWQVSILPGFYALHTYFMEDIGNGRTRFGSWEKAYGWSFRLMKKFWLAHFTFVKDKSLEGAKYLESVYRRSGNLDLERSGTAQSNGGQFLSDETPSTGSREKRPLRVNAPQTHFFTTEDGVRLMLTRYQAGSKGPVICSHGLGVSSRIFSTDMIETNLLEYLFSHDYDVWLLDYRSSIELPTADDPATGDDIAKYDYPAAVQNVLKITGADSVQMVVHCFGAMTWTMAMLNGLQGVRAAVCSQISAHARAPLVTNIKSGLYLPGVLDKLGVDTLTAYTDAHDDWPNKLFNTALKHYPVELEERCDNSVCHRVTFLYSLLYEHDQLNSLLHDNLHELFGVASIKQFEHLAQTVREGHVVDANGENVYLPHLDRLAIPITFIHGAENACFLPESTELTFEQLCKKNGKSLYNRHVIPDYGHIDCIFGKNAAKDVYPLIVEHLDATQ